MTDRYQVIRDALPILIAEAQAKGGRNERAALIVELLEERDALEAENERLREELSKMGAEPSDEEISAIIGKHFQLPGNACRAHAAIAEVLRAQPAAGEEIMVNAPGDVFTLPLRPSGLSSGPRFVVHVPGPEQPAAAHEPCAAVAAIQFALTDPEGMTFLHLWNEGEFDTLRREWPDAPSAVYVGADPLAAQHQEDRNG